MDRTETQQASTLKQKRRLFCCMFVMLAAVAGLTLSFMLWKQPVETEVDAQMMYCFHLATAGALVLCSYLAISRKTWHHLIRWALLFVPAFAQLCNTVVFGDHNLIYIMPFLLVASLFLWPKE